MKLKIVCGLHQLFLLLSAFFLLLDSLKTVGYCQELLTSPRPQQTAFLADPFQEPKAFPKLAEQQKQQQTTKETKRFAFENLKNEEIVTFSNVRKVEDLLGKTPKAMPTVISKNSTLSSFSAARNSSNSHLNFSNDTTLSLNNVTNVTTLQEPLARNEKKTDSWRAKKTEEGFAKSLGNFQNPILPLNRKQIGIPKNFAEEKSKNDLENLLQNQQKQQKQESLQLRRKDKEERKDEELGNEKNFDYDGNDITEIPSEQEHEHGQENPLLTRGKYQENVYIPNSNQYGQIYPYKFQQQHEVQPEKQQKLQKQDVENIHKPKHKRQFVSRHNDDEKQESQQFPSQARIVGKISSGKVRKIQEQHVGVFVPTLLLQKMHVEEGFKNFVEFFQVNLQNTQVDFLPDNDLSGFIRLLEEPKYTTIVKILNTGINVDDDLFEGVPLTQGLHEQHGQRQPESQQQASSHGPTAIHQGQQRHSKNSQENNLNFFSSLPVSSFSSESAPPTSTPPPPFKASTSFRSRQHSTEKHPAFFDGIGFCHLAEQLSFEFNKTVLLWPCPKMKESDNFLPSFEAISFAVKSIATKLNWTQVDIFVGDEALLAELPKQSVGHSQVICREQGSQRNWANGLYLNRLRSMEVHSYSG